MELEQVHTALEKIFNEEKERIVFWNDPEGEFVHLVPFVLLDDVTCVHVNEESALELKIRLEVDDLEGRYLLYTPAEEPAFEDDWLLDIRQYSRPFRADRVTIILEQLGLSQRQDLRPHIAKRRKFFDNQERIRKLKQFVAKDDSAQDLDRKMLAAVSKASQPDLANIVRTLFHAMSEADEFDFDAAPKFWEEIEKYELDQPFWDMVSATFGYREESPRLQNLLIRLFVSDFARQVGRDLPPSLENLRLSKSGEANAVVCLAQWRDSNSLGVSYNRLAAEVGGLIHIEDELHPFDVEELIEVSTFFEVELVIVSALAKEVEGGGPIDAERVRARASRRQAGHWIASASVAEDKRSRRASVYEALASAAEFIALRDELEQGFDYPDARSFYQAYQERLCRFDQLYRRFTLNADNAKGWDILKPLRQTIENHYCNWYLLKLGLAWGKCVSDELLATWKIEGVPNQYDFFKRQVKPHLDEAENRRAFVIVSDALRYEAAEELTQALNIYRFQAELTSQLGVLPSYTKLGMASLLPHETLAYSDTGDVQVDGKSASSLEQRSQILAAHGGVAIRGSDLMAMKKEQGREFVAGKRVVYIYHDEIDATGDHAASESKTFEAVAKAIEDIKQLATYVVNNLNGYHLLITADHGFLFTVRKPDATDKSKLADKPAGTVLAKKRYLLGKSLPENAEVFHGETAVTASAEGGMEFWTPRGANLFHFMGGARFIHGGTMLQEIVVPVIRVRHVKGGKAVTKTKTKNVPVQVLGASHKITAPVHRFTLIQTEAVSDRVKPVTLKVAVYEGEEPVTSIETVVFDSTSNDVDERQKSVKLTLEDREFDKKTQYRLVLRDAKLGVEHFSTDVTIDRAIIDDF